MKLYAVIIRLRAGDQIHMQFLDGRRVWWFEEPHENVPDTIMQAVQKDGGLAEAGDSLFGLPANSQTWLVSEEYGDAP